MDVPRTARRDTGFSDKTNSRSDEVDTGMVPLDDIRVGDKNVINSLAERRISTLIRTFDLS